MAPRNAASAAVNSPSGSAASSGKHATPIDSVSLRLPGKLDTATASRRRAAFVNAPDTADPDLMYVEERGQLRPAREDERTVLISGDSLQVRRMEERTDGVRV